MAKNFRRGWVVAALVIAGSAPAYLSMQGCATSASPVENNAIRYYQTERMYASTVNTMTALGNAGKVDRAAAERFETVRVSASRLLGQWRASVLNGQPWDNWAALESLLEELVQIQLESANP